MPEQKEHRRFFYPSYCTDNGNRAFICEYGVDNNIAEVFVRNDNESLEENAQRICDALNQE